jgi:phosphonate C-P lyase system protein PhnH
VLLEVDAMTSAQTGEESAEPAAEPATNPANPAHKTLRGPGIERTQALRVSGLPAGFWDQLRVNQRHFPLGVDVILCCDTSLCGLPRTTRIED